MIVVVEVVVLHDVVLVLLTDGPTLPEGIRLGRPDVLLTVRVRVRMLVLFLHGRLREAVGRRRDVEFEAEGRPVGGDGKTNRVELVGVDELKMLLEEAVRTGEVVFPGGVDDVVEALSYGGGDDVVMFGVVELKMLLEEAVTIAEVVLPVGVDDVVAALSYGGDDDAVMFKDNVADELDENVVCTDGPLRVDVVLFV